MIATGRRRDSGPWSCKSLAAMDKIRLPAPAGWRPDNSFGFARKQLAPARHQFRYAAAGAFEGAALAGETWVGHEVFVRRERMIARLAAHVARVGHQVPALHIVVEV